MTAAEAVTDIWTNMWLSTSLRAGITVIKLFLKNQYQTMASNFISLY